MPRLAPRRTALFGLLAALFLSTAEAAPAFNYVQDANGTFWGIQDAAAPRVDTGSVRATQAAPGNAGAYTTAINGYGGLRVSVATTPAPRFDGALMRGFGLKFDGLDHFDTTQAVALGGVAMTRSVWVNRGADWTRWLDTFTNTTRAPLTVRVAFGGQSGQGALTNTAFSSTSTTTTTTPNITASFIAATQSGDTGVAADDGWVDYASPPPASPSATNLILGDQVPVLGTPSTSAAPFGGALDATGNFLHDTFTSALVGAGHESNFGAFITTLTIPAGATRSLLHFLVLGPRTASTAAAATARTAAQNDASALVGTPSTAGLSAAQLCSITNFTQAALGNAATDCATVGGLGLAPAADVRPPVTSSPYDVVGKTIGQMRADMASGATTSQRITRAYLDRIAAYDQGQFGFNSFEYVAKDAMAQAKAADDARAAGARGKLLGIPFGIKNLFDTKDMPTTNGSLTFEGFRPARDAFQVAKLREAGAVILGKAALEEYATSGNYSDDPFGQTWNAFDPSKSAIASSGGPATATALSLDAAALGSQTGDSLYGPASGASLVSLRGTDGLESGTGVMPLGFLTDFGGVMTRSVPDLADVLDAVTAADPADPATADNPGYVPAEWRDTLDPDALKGKRIGLVPSTFVDPFGTSGTTDASLDAARRYLTAAGATIVTMGTSVGAGYTDAPDASTVPTPPGNLNAEGWGEYIDAHPELAAQGFDLPDFRAVQCSQKKVAFTRFDPATNPTCTSPNPDRLTAAQVQAFRDRRKALQGVLKAWMDKGGADGAVDAVVYPGLLSDISLNDGGGGKASFGRKDTPSAGFGSPTVIFPAGVNDHRQPINLQLLGRAKSDPMLVGMAYAFELKADAEGRGHQEPATAPALPFQAGAEPQRIVEPTAAAPTQPAGDTTPAAGADLTAFKQVKIAISPSSTAKVSRGFATVVVKNTSKLSVYGRATLAGKVKGHAKRVTFGSVSLSIPAGRSETLRVYLGPSARKAIGRHTRYAVLATFTLANDSSARAIVARALTLQVAKG